MTEHEIDGLKLGQELFDSTVLPRKVTGRKVVDRWGKPVLAYLTLSTPTREWRFRVHILRPPGGTEPPQGSFRNADEAIEGLKKWLRENELG